MLAETCPEKGVAEGQRFFLFLQFRNASHTRLGDGYGCPSRRCVFPLVISQRPLIGAICVHHKELAVGLRNAVVEWRLIFETETGAAEDNMLSIWRPYSVCIISRSSGESLYSVPSGLIV